MSTPIRYVCWNEAAVLATTPRDAATLGPGHFQAVHHPLRLRRRRLGERSGGRWVPESEIAKVLSGPLRPDGYLFIPIVGGSGTGKSHLVRWVHEHTAETPSWEARYLAKNRTSIRRVIEVVIEGLSGPAIDAAHDALESAPAHTESADVLAERLLDELALLVAADDSDHQAQDGGERQLRKKVREQLPDVLRDPVVRRRLTAENGVVVRLVGLAQKGRRDGDGLDDDATRVTASDLPLTFEDLGDASRGARQLLNQMATLPKLLDAAVSAINRALPGAVKRVFVSSQVDLIEVFREVRRSLLDQGKELVLFIEDLTVLHGVEREFLDAIVEPAVSPDGRLCNLRVVFAVTEGHFDDLDTVRTRCDDAYWLDSTYGDDGVDTDEALSFLGRYLNATRLIPEELEQDWTGRHGKRWLSNACSSCEFQTDCHAAFGASAEGYGLYPFDRAAVSRFVSVLSPARFDPRLIVRELVSRVLLQGAVEISGSSFPSDDLLASFDRASEPLEALLTSELKNQRPTDHEQLSNLIRYWSEDMTPGSLSSDIVRAFGIDPLPDDLRAKPATTSRAQRTSSTAQRTQQQSNEDQSTGVDQQLRSPWRSHFNELERWAGQGADLTAKATNDLRNLVHEAVEKNLEFGALPVNLGKDFDEARFKADRDILIRGSVTVQTREDAPIVVERSPDSAAALQGLILLRHAEGGTYDRASEFRQVAGEHLQTWTARAASALANPLSPSTSSSVEGLILCAMVAGHCETAADSSSYLEVLFSPPPHRAPDPNRSDKWTALLELVQSSFPKLKTDVDTMFGEARGTAGGVRAVRADLLLEVIDPFVREWKLDATNATVKSLMRAVTPAVDAEWALLRDRALLSSPHLQMDRPWDEQASKVVQLIGDAYRAGRLRDADAYGVLQRLAEHIPTGAHRSVAKAVEHTSTDRPLDYRLRVVAGSLPTDVALVSQFVSVAARALDGLESDLDDLAKNAGESDLTKVVEQVQQSLSRFVAAMEAITT